MSTVLIITKSTDNTCIDTVSEAVRARGGRAVRLDTDRFPTEVRLATDERGTGRLITPEDELDLSAVTAIWHRRLEIGSKLPQDMDAQMRHAALLESRATLMGLLASLDAFRLDKMETLRKSEQKQLQLKAARALGLEVPKTLISNDPAAVRQFAAACPGGIITKMMASFAIYEEGRENVVFTNVIKPEDLENMEGLELCPMTFQEKIEKEIELRVTVVGDRVFSAAVDSNAMDRSKSDWRREGVALLDAWKPHPLPAEIEKKLVGVMDFFELNYGAMDVILTPDGRYVFIEVNPAGEFFWLDKLFAPTISDALADTLVGRSLRRGV